METEHLPIGDLYPPILFYSGPKLNNKLNLRHQKIERQEMTVPRLLFGHCQEDPDVFHRLQKTDNIGTEKGCHWMTQHKTI